jgi:ATP-dependent Lon protease
VTFKKKNSNVLDYQQEEESAAMFGGYMRAGDIPEGSRVVKSFKIDPNMPDTAKAALQRISANHNQNDYGLAENQMRILTELPWTDMADLPRAKVNIKIAEQKLDSRLLGEEKAKARILEQIALSNRSFKAPIKPLIFVGPPGTGKTFTAKLVAEIRGVPAEVISFPAVCESWEIMGSNKGWNNSDAGYITKSLVKHKRVPCFIFDEIDKAEQGNPQRTPPPLSSEFDSI